MPQQGTQPKKTDMLSSWNRRFSELSFTDVGEPQNSTRTTVVGGFGFERQHSLREELTSCKKGQGDDFEKHRIKTIVPLYVTLLFRESL